MDQRAEDHWDGHNRRETQRVVIDGIENGASALAFRIERRLANQARVLWGIVLIVFAIGVWAGTMKANQTDLRQDVDATAAATTELSETQAAIAEAAKALRRDINRNEEAITELRRDRGTP